MWKALRLSGDKYVILSSVAFISAVILFNSPLVKTAFSTASNIERNSASSPSFPNQEIIDPDFDWIHMKNNSYTRNGDYSTNIESVDYYSDGKTLEAILWLYFPFQVNQSRLNEEVNYGMYIDADFSERTGNGGIEYKFELGWNNQSKKWNKVLEKWSHYGETIVLDNQTIPYTSFSKKDAHYVRLIADLETMLFPKKYKVVFYGEVRRDGDLISDYTRMVAIPPLELFVSSTPNSVELRRGETKTLEVKVNTTQGYEPTINLNATSPSKYLVADFTQNDASSDHDYILRIPSYGIATVPLTIGSTENAPIGPFTLFIFANSSFPPDQLIKSSYPQDARASSNSSLPPSALTSENIFTHSSLLVNVREPLTWIDHLSNFWDKLGQPLAFITGIITGHIGPWLYVKIRQRWVSRR
ncbi:MAG TPA: hypothetical protein VFR94_26000 [Nitrososphaeraceae archaeon]|nr:hypothetical protein [Nitrososphaeraceae archaeon]